VHELVAVACTGPAFVDALRAAWDRGDAVLPVDPRLPATAIEGLLAAMAPHRVVAADGTVTERPDGRPTDVDDALVVTTSGSTGTPKGVVHTHASLEASARASSAVLEVDAARDRWLCCLPLAHIAGLAVVVRALVTGTELEVHDRFDADRVTDAARRGATLTSLVPTALARIDPAEFRRVVVGGSAPPEHVPPNCHVTYGMTETGSGVVYDGLPLDGVELRVVDDEILVRGPMLMRGYRDGTTSIDDEGWLHTDDAGELDADGRLHVRGRRGDLIITGGENVWPAPVERLIHDHPGVSEVAVVGRVDREWGQVVTALVVPVDPARPPSLDDLRTLVRAQLPAHCAPRRLELIEALPRTLLGKVQRRALGAG
jgi:O-succinylbenzoic acid--CoA ligase